MGWAFFYMFVILKIPIIAALWIVWWAVRDPASPDEEPVDVQDDGGGSPHRRRPRPRPPRRGPHAEPLPPSPERMRVTAYTPPARIEH